MNFIKKLIIFSGLALNFTGPMLGTIYRADHLAKDDLSVYMFSDCHEIDNPKIKEFYGKIAIENVEKSTKQILKAAKKICPFFIIEDQFESIDPEFYEIFKKPEYSNLFNNQDLSAFLNELGYDSFDAMFDLVDKKTKLREKYRTDYLGLLGLVDLAKKENINAINVDSHRPHFTEKVLLNLYSIFGNRSAVTDITSIMLKWIKFIDENKGDLSTKYRSLENGRYKKFNKTLFEKVSATITSSGNDRQLASDYFKSLISLLGNIYLEVKVLHEIEQHKAKQSKQPIFIYIGGGHIDQIRETLLNAGFKCVNDTGITTKQAISINKKNQLIDPVDLSKIFEPSLLVKMRLFLLNNHKKIDYLAAAAVELAIFGLAYYYRNTIKNVIRSYLPHSLLRYLPQWTQKSKR